MITVFDDLITVMTSLILVSPFLEIKSLFVGMQAFLFLEFSFKINWMKSKFKRALKRRQGVAKQLLEK